LATEGAGRAETAGVPVPTGMRRGFRASGTVPDGDAQQAVRQVRVIDHDVVGKDEAAFEGPGGDAAMQHFARGCGIGQTAGHHQRVILDVSSISSGPKPATAMVRT
jgi:hypothetical protein